MTEKFNNLSTVVEIETESSVNMNDECSEERPEIIPGIKINPNRFRMLCDNVQTCFCEIDKSMFQVLELKDKLLLQYLPPNVLLQITFVLSRFYRAYSQTQVPVYELIRLVQLYSEPFDMKCIVLKRLYDGNEVKKRMLNLALQKLTSMENHTEQYQEQKCIDHWEKMYIRLALPRGNVRKWKFRIKTFREKAELGYEHVIEWLHTRVLRPSLVAGTLPNEELVDDQCTNRVETSNEIITLQEMNEPKLQIDQGSNEGNEHNNRIRSAKKQHFEPQVSKIDIEIQAQPDFDNQQTSTEDILSTKSLIMRIYRPIGIVKTKFQCIVYAQGRKYTTKMFIFNKLNARMTSGSRTTKPKKQNEVSTISDNIDINTIDKQQTDEFIIPMPNVLTRRSLFQTDIDPDVIKIDILADEKLCGSFLLSSEDLRMLDLPTLQSPIVSPFITLEDNPSSNGQLNFDQSSNELYQSWICRTPPTFLIYNNKHESIGKLPLLMFWYEKLENKYATKSTMTNTMEIRVPTPKIDIFIPPVVPPRIDENMETNSSDDHIDLIKSTYENEIAKLHEIYQAEIHRLTNLLNKILSDHTIEISELDENTPEIIEENLSNTKTRGQTKRQVPLQRPSSSVYGKDLPKNFLDRYQMYLQRSLIHRHQLIAKVEQETALANERQMEFQHRLYKPEQNIGFDDDLCLPAVFMPFRSGNIINPRAYQFFHSIGSTAPRLTQAPSILKFPSLPSRTVSVLNLFELSRSFENTNEKDHSTNQTSHSTVRPTTQASD